ncbi:hypothetical protein K438DRAFT_1781521 [Mycena galopus ATCC 62051]|nr:hypothetical protein K438DRAFT_1781521 [Mycena galopus ATCC 62051]
MDGITESPVASFESPSRTNGAKRRRENTVDIEERKKIAKIGAKPGRTSPHPFFASVSELHPINSISKPSKVVSKKKVKGKPNAPFPAVGLSRTATTARRMNEDVRSGTFVPSAAKTKNFQNKSRMWDSECGFKPTCTLVQCSHCKAWKKMSKPYNTKYFRAHQVWKLLPSCTHTRSFYPPHFQFLHQVSNTSQAKGKTAEIFGTLSRAYRSTRQACCQQLFGLNSRYGWRGSCS